ncbi:hypothetical protein HDU99_007876 [Rhizoclosmatium hyalinum]|nr:hypothetical protein HDU99_007876 [Rhizoclosmatium hyalinum]
MFWLIEQLNRIAHKLGTADSHAQIADAKANQLKSTNRFFMLPTSFADKKAASVEAQQNERMEAQGEAEAKRRVAASTNNGASYISLSNTTTSSSYYTTPDGLERDEVEEEIDSSLGQMAAGLGRMKQMANAMSTELDSQNESIKQTKGKVDEVKNRVEVTNAKIKKIK